MMNWGNGLGVTAGPRTPIQDRMNSTAGNDRNACSLRDGAGKEPSTEPSFDGTRMCASRGYDAFLVICCRFRVAFKWEAG